MKAELQRVLAPGSTVYLLGGTSALSDRVFSDVAGLGFVPKRISGGDRYQTAAAIAQNSAPTPHVFLVGTGVNFPDALAAGAAAGANPDAVVLLSSDRTLPAATRDYLAAHYHAGDILLGVGVQGSDALKTAYPTLPIANQLRGVDRFDTAAKLANFFYSGPYPARTVGLAVGGNWPDALGGGALLGAHPGPLLLTDASGIPASERAYLSTNSAAVKEIVVFGGTRVVSDAAQASVANGVAGAGGGTGM
ncbi:cell wall-binding repeat-containing protein [Catenulispora yoronensis]